MATCPHFLVSEIHPNRLEGQYGAYTRERNFLWAVGSVVGNRQRAIRWSLLSGAEGHFNLTVLSDGQSRGAVVALPERSRSADALDRDVRRACVGERCGLRCARRFDQLSGEGKTRWCQRHTHRAHALTCQGDRLRTGSSFIGNDQLGLPVADGGRRKRYLDLDRKST